MNPYGSTDEIEMDPSAPTDIIKKKLFNNAMEGNWNEVFKIYKNHVEAHRVKITKCGDTAIHVAVYDGQDDMVEKLVAIVDPDHLTIENDLGNTPLHMAAIMGNVTMCECIARKNRGLIGVPNKDNETPFFLAVVHGKRDAFLCLHSLCNKEKGYSYCRRKNDGDTILHSAIAGEYFDIAFDIINLYEDLINFVNEKGLSPLHLLANKPTAFKSAGSISGFRKLIYHCIFVDELQQSSSTLTPSKHLKYDPNAKYPETYQTCMSMAYSLGNIIRTLFRKSSQQADAENPVDQSTRQVVKRPDSNESVNNQQEDMKNKQGKRPTTFRAQGHQFFPENYLTCFNGLKLLSKIMLVFLGLGLVEIVKLRRKKEKHVWSIQIMEKLLEKASTYEYEDNGRSPPDFQPIKEEETTPYTLDSGSAEFGSASVFLPPYIETPSPPNESKKVEESQQTNGNAGQKEKFLEIEKGETPILIAAKNGVMEMVKSILKLFPVAIHDVNNNKKNIVLLAVENRQPHVYQFLLNHKMKETIFRQTDKDGNSAVHLASTLGDDSPWRIPGAALQMQWEIKWSKYVKGSMGPQFFPRYNKDGKTAGEIFTAAHKDLVKAGGKWLTNTSQSCSVVAALIATVAFATSSTVPGGLNQESGFPTLEDQPAFSLFAISSLIALCFSVTSLVMFLAILTSRYQEKDFGKSLPRKLLIGMTTLFIGIAFMLVSFCAGHFFVLKRKLQYVAFPVYALTCLPVTFFAVVQFPLYFDLALATFSKLPRRCYK